MPPLSFEQPPVVEVQLGLQFDPLPNLNSIHFGLLWSRLGMDRWPSVAEVPPMPQQFEKFGDEVQWASPPTISFTLLQQPSSRIQLSNSSRDRMVQFQNGRFWYSWIGTSGSAYPRYESIRDEMFAVFEQAIALIHELNLGDVRLNQWEVNYINHLPRGTVWNDASDWTKVFSSNAMLPAKVAESSLEQFGGNWNYLIPQSQGRLHVQLQSGRDKPDGVDILLLQLLARGPLSIKWDGREGAKAALAIGHDTIINGFRDLTSQEARNHWKEVS